MYSLIKPLVTCHLRCNISSDPNCCQEVKQGIAMASDPANFFSSSLSVPALFFLRTLPSTTAFLFCLSVLHATSVSTSQMLPVVLAHFRRRVQVSAPYNATFHTKHFASLVFSSFSKGPQKMLLSLLKSFFCHFCPLFYPCFLTAVKVATDIAPQISEAVHLLDGFVFNSNVLSSLVGE